MEQFYTGELRAKPSFSEPDSPPGHIPVISLGHFQPFPELRQRGSSLRFTADENAVLLIG
jgi:hypothetical protein